MKNLDFISNEFVNTIKSTKNLSQKTVMAYKSDLKDFCKFFRNKEFDDSMALEYVQYLTGERKLKESTINRKLVVLKIFFEYMFSEGYIYKNYFLSHKFKFKKERRLPKVLETEETSKILKNLVEQNASANTPYEIWKTARNLALIDVLISTGIRIGEASAIALDDIFLSERTILIHGKGRKERIIYISCPQTWTNLTRWLKARTSRPIYTDKLFVNKYGKQISIHGIEYIYRKLKESSNINEKSTPHYLRHTFGTNLLSNGADLRSVQEILGHSCVSTTEIYTEVSTKRKRQILNKYNYRNKL